MDPRRRAQGDELEKSLPPLPLSWKVRKEKKNEVEREEYGLSSRTSPLPPRNFNQASMFLLFFGFSFVDPVSAILLGDEEG